MADAGSALRELGATVVVEGSLRRDGQMIQLTVNLVNTKNLRQVGSVTLEDRAGDFSSLEDEAVARHRQADAHRGYAGDAARDRRRGESRSV